MRCLVVDANVAFATLLSEELSRLGHDALMCYSGTEASAVAEEEHPDLVLLDMGLEGPDARAVARALREQDPAVRLMVIPLMGEVPQWDAAAPSIQGVLPKPFFLPELPERIEKAMAAPVLDALVPAGDRPGLAERHRVGRVVGEDAVQANEAAHAVPFAGAPRREAFVRHEAGIVALLHDLAFEMGAEGALLADGGGMLTAVGALAAGELQALSEVVLQGRRSSSEVGRILGREQVRFEQSLTGGDYTLYALGLDGEDPRGAPVDRCDAILALVVAGETPLGLLRHRARSTGARIVDLLYA